MIWLLLCLKYKNRLILFFFLRWIFWTYWPTSSVTSIYIYLSKNQSKVSLCFHSTMQYRFQKCVSFLFSKVKEKKNFIIMMVKKTALLHRHWLTVKHSKEIQDSTGKYIKTTVHSRKGANQYYLVTTTLWSSPSWFGFTWRIVPHTPTNSSPQTPPCKRSIQEAENK